MMTKPKTMPMASRRRQRQPATSRSANAAAGVGAGVVVGGVADVIGHRPRTTTASLMKTPQREPNRKTSRTWTTKTTRTRSSAASRVQRARPVMARPAAKVARVGVGVGVDVVGARTAIAMIGRKKRTAAKAAAARRSGKVAVRPSGTPATAVTAGQNVPGVSGVNANASRAAVVTATRAVGATANANPARISATGTANATPPLPPSTNTGRAARSACSSTWPRRRKSALP